ncbi:hypothetical protein CMUS01_01201 [Colletotrichum musicola]|uniref:Uncharacterized protein n=1 Tax=Colletotrichum musicola TaxID=2175873 RepID=A0A8H6U8S4_9PEZI|nr:hypothetical protein CMUS01_01201 [Colletotrichum musicola]
MIMMTTSSSWDDDYCARLQQEQPPRAGQSERAGEIADVNSRPLENSPCSHRLAQSSLAFPVRWGLD